MHRANGAEFAEEDGWILPLRFGDPLREYQTVRSQVGMLDLCHRCLLCLTGSDRVSYLQGMVSNDVKKLTPGEGIHAAVLDVQGKILADTRILHAGESFLLELWQPLKEKILAHLSRYLVADDVEIADLTGQYGVISLQGPKALTLLKGLLPQGQFLSKELDHRTFQIGGGEVHAVRSTHTGEEGCDLLIDQKDLAAVTSRVQETGKKFSVGWIGTQAQEILRIEAGIPRYGVDMDENNLLLETGLDRAVSFQKGCYLGQEVVERVRSRGHVNKRLVGMVLEGEAPERGDPIRAKEREIGKITSSVFSPALKRPIALGYVHRDYTQPGTALNIDRNGKTIAGLVSALPFYRPSPS